MEQIALSIEQMKYLEALGLDTSDASMSYLQDITDGPYYLQVNYSDCKIRDYYAYTLQDILNKFTSYIDINYSVLKIYKSSIDNTYEVSYESKDINNSTYQVYKNISLLDAAYDMLCWCIENGYIII